MLASVFGLLGSLAALLTCRKNFVLYQLCLLIVFLVGLMISGELDFVLPIYLLTALSPYLLKKNKLAPFPLLYISVAGAYLAYGLVCQSAAASLVAFLSRFCQFIVFFIVVDNIAASADLKPGVRIVVLAAIAESLIGLYLIKNGSVAFSTTSTEIRLVANSQPITGNIAIAILPYIGYLFYTCEKGSRNQTVLIACLMVLGFWVVLSGTRGYMLVFIVCLAFLAIGFFAGKTRSRRTGEGILLVSLLCLIAAIVAFAVYQDAILEKISSALRLHDSLGVREHENNIALSFFNNSDAFVRAFGIGIGGSWSDYPAYDNAVFNEFGGTGYQGRYMGRMGTNFHNFYANILGMQGLIGLALSAGVFIWIGMIVFKKCARVKGLRVFLIVYLICFAAMLYYRWSADCGIGEMIMLAYVLNLVDAKAHRREESKTSAV